MKCLTLFINQYCNRKCIYCDIPTLKNKKSFNKKLFIEYLPLINKSNFDKIIFTGGEIGLLDIESIEILFKINKKIQVNTNGLFIQKYMNEYYDKIDSIQYHPVKEISEEIKNVYVDKKIKYLIPVHKDNIKYLKSFLLLYNDLIFEISPYDSKFNEEFILTKSDYIEIISILNECKNVTQSSIQTFNMLSKIDDLTTLRKICNCNLFIEVDFTSGYINNCVCSYTRSSKIKLTPETFKNIDSLKFDTPSLCDSCLSCVVWFDTLIKNKIEKKTNEKIYYKKNGNLLN